MKKLLWRILGFVSLGFAYIGVVTPGIPYSPFVVFSAYCFAKSSPKMHAWIMNHKMFGPFINNWNHKRVFPLKLKFFMIASMSLSLVLMYVSSMSVRGIAYTGIFMLLVAVWAWRYPSTVEEWQHRKDNNKKIGWIK